MLAGEIGRGDGKQRGDAGIGNIGILARRLVRVDQAAQVMDAHAKMPFMRPAAGTVQGGLVSAAGTVQCRLQHAVQIGTQSLGTGPG